MVKTCSENRKRTDLYGWEYSVGKREEVVVYLRDSYNSLTVIAWPMVNWKWNGMMGIIINKLPSSNWIILEFGGSKLSSICLLLFSDVNEMVTLYICGEEILTDLTIQKLDSSNFSVVLCEFCISIGWTWFYWNQSQTCDRVSQLS